MCRASNHPIKLSLDVAGVPRGTGSGFTSLLVERLSVDYGKRMLALTPSRMVKGKKAEMSTRLTKENMLHT